MQNIITPNNSHKAERREESARFHMVENISRANADDTVDQVINRLKNRRYVYDTVDYTFVVDKEGKLLGAVSIKELLTADKDKKVSSLMTRKLAVVHPSTDQERAAYLAIKYNIKAVPVVNKKHVLIGVVPSDVIMNILQWEHVEDMLRISGIQGRGNQLNNLLKTSFLKISAIRMPSLLIGLLGGLLATKVVSHFHASLEQELALAFFIPVIVYLSAAVGQQSQTILIRSLALEQIKMLPYALRELAAGLLIGTIIGAIMTAIVYVWFSSVLIALTIGVSLVLTVTTATLVSVVITWALTAAKKDPAIAGGPFATVIQDILSLLIYFTVASAILL